MVKKVKGLKVGEKIKFRSICMYIVGVFPDKILLSKKKDGLVRLAMHTYSGNYDDLLNRSEIHREKENQ